MPAQDTTKCPERLNPAFIPMFFPLLRDQSVVSQFHGMTWCFSRTLVLHGTEGKWRRYSRFQDKNCLVMGLGTHFVLFLFVWVEWHF